MKLQFDDETRVIFKMTPKDGFYESEVIAFLLDVYGNSLDNIMSYMHIGQHSEASFQFFYKCKLATPEQYADLKTELESIGYKLLIRQRFVRQEI